MIESRRDLRVCTNNMKTFAAIESPIVRAAKPGELAQIIELTRMAWPGETGAHFQADPWFDWGQFRVARLNGDIVGMLKIYRREIRWGDSTAVVGGIGDVVTHPDYRNRGFARLVIDDAIRYLTENGYELSILFSGLTALYRRFGWKPLPQPLSSGTLEQFRLHREPKYQLRLFNPVSDLKEVSSIYESGNTGRHGSIFRTKEYWEAQLSWKREEAEAFFVALEQDAIVGYVRGKRVDNVFQVFECISLDPHRDCEVDLALQATRYALDQGCTRFEVALPADNCLTERLGKIGTELTKGTCSLLMLQPIAVQALAKKLSLDPSTPGSELIGKMPPFHFWGPDSF